MSRAYHGLTTQRDLNSVKKRMAKSTIHRTVAVMDKNDRMIALIWDNTDKRSGRKNLLNTIRMITLYANGTSFKTACELTGLKVRGCEPWKNADWFKECVQIAKDRMDAELDGKFTGIVNKGADNLAEQLELGESVLAKDGSLVRKPVSAKDTAIITSIVFDKRNLLRGKPTGITESKSSSDRLSELQEKFKQFAAATEVEGEVIEQESE